MGPKTKLSIVAICSLAIGGFIALLQHQPKLNLASIRTAGKALVGGPFTLVDHNGKTVTEKDFLGKYTLIYFGFTQCPDVCPGSLQIMAEALDKLSPQVRAKIRPVLISIDPERDTPETLKAYVEDFHPNLVGLTGTIEQVRTAARAYRVFFTKNKTGDGPNDYTMDHSSIYYLMGPDGRFRTHFVHGTKVDAMATSLQQSIK